MAPSVVLGRVDRFPLVSGQDRGAVMVSACPIQICFSPKIGEIEVKQLCGKEVGGDS